MSYFIDANILIYATNEHSEFHKKAHEFIKLQSQKEETWAMPWPAVHAFLRIVTHPAIMPQPLSGEDAVAIMDQILSQPNIQLMGEGEGFWELYKREITTLHLRGNVLSDALLVAILKANSITTVYSKDRDFLRFEGMKVIDPLA